MNNSSLYIFLLAVLSVICFTVSAASVHSEDGAASNVPTYYPGDGISVRFTDDNPFIFLWPERWSGQSALSFVLVAVNDGQTAAEAIVSNEALYREDGITTYYVHYPLNRQPLENGEYAWQVKNANGTVLLTTSFRIDSLREDPYQVYQRKTLCMYPKEKQEGGYHVAYDKIIRLHFTEPYEVRPSQRLRFCIYDSHRNIVLRTDEEGNVVEYAATSIISPVIKTGENWVQLDVEGNCVFYEDHLHNYADDYYLEVWDSKGEKGFLRFRCMYSIPFVAIDSGE